MLQHMEMTITEAATHLGITTDTLRRRIRKGTVSARQSPRPQGHVWFVDIDTDETARENQATPTGRADDNDLVELLKGQVQDLKAMLEKRDRDLENRTREISELHQLLGARSLNPGVDRPWWAIWRR